MGGRERLVESVLVYVLEDTVVDVVAHRLTSLDGSAVQHTGKEDMRNERRHDYMMYLHRDA